MRQRLLPSPHTALGQGSDLLQRLAPPLSHALQEMGIHVIYQAVYVGLLLLSVAYGATEKMLRSGARAWGSGRGDGSALPILFQPPHVAGRLTDAVFFKW